MFIKSVGILLPVCVLIKNRRKFLPAENAKRSLAAVTTLAEKATAAAIAGIAAVAKTNAVPVGNAGTAGIAAAAATEKTIFTSER